MTKKYNLEDLKEFSGNPFVNYKSDEEFDELFIDALSKTAKSLIKYIVYKQAFEEEEFSFHVNEFNRFMKYINMPDPSDGLAELCVKTVLAKTKDADLYWVNKEIFNTGVFQPKYIMCKEKERTS